MLERQFEEFTTNEKMTHLIEHQENLITNDRTRRENKRGIQTVCRIQGSNQSYFIFDSLKYKIAREIYFSLDDEEQIVNDTEESTYRSHKNDQFEDESESEFSYKSIE